MDVQSRVVIEPSAQGMVDATSSPPWLDEMEPAAARKVLDELQADPVGLRARTQATSFLRDALGTA